jgi:hypothetical protein
MYQGIFESHLDKFAFPLMSIAIASKSCPPHPTFLRLRHPQMGPNPRGFLSKVDEMKRIWNGQCHKSFDEDNNEVHHYNKWPIDMGNKHTLLYSVDNTFGLKNNGLCDPGIIRQKQKCQCTMQARPK